MKLEVTKEQLELLEFMIQEFEYLDEKVNYIVDKSIDYQDSEILEEWEDLFDVHTVLENTKQEYEDKLAKARAKQPKAEW